MSRNSGKLLIVFTILSLVAIMAGCGDEDTGTTKTVATSVGGASTSGRNTVEVTIADFKFEPADLTIPMGTTVKWTNKDAVPHTATADVKAFDSGNLNEGDSFEFTFDEEGSYPYMCTYHPRMEGTITVE